jgi:hypothetical protein
MQMLIIILVERFENGVWKFWDHLCEEDEILALSLASENVRFENK